MKIGLMLRGVDKQGGTGVYAKNLVPELLELGSDHEWFLLYQHEHQRDAFETASNVRSVVLPSGSAIFWDQILVPRFASKAGLDVLFNTKFTLPIIRRRGLAQVMSLHGASWYVIPECYPWWDVLYIKAMMPLYCRAADRLVSNSECTTKDYEHYVNVPLEKMTTIPLAAAETFRPVDDAATLERARSRYGLPERFVLSVVGYDPRKNVPRLLKAFEKCSGFDEFSLVLIGKGCERFRNDLPDLFARLGDRLVITGWVDQRDLPTIYSLASVFFFPSVYEEFGIPNCEAMACGLPIVTSNTAAPPEVVGDSGILVEPTSIDDMANGLSTVLGDAALRAELSERSLARSERYSWRRTAAATLQVLIDAAR